MPTSRRITWRSILPGSDGVILTCGLTLASLGFAHRSINFLPTGVTPVCGGSASLRLRAA